MNIKKGIVVGALMLATGLVACNSGSMRRNPGRTYAPDMTYSRAYDAYTENPNFLDSQSSRMPIQGTIARGHDMPDHLIEGDTLAYNAFSTTAKFDETGLKEGKRLFNIYCAICHGVNMDGQGPLYTSGKFAAMPANLKGELYLRFPVGKIYAAIKYGKNSMGSYASQLDIHQRWQIIAYIRQVQSQNGGMPFTMGLNMPADTTKKAPAAAADTAAKGKIALNTTAH